MKIKDQAVLEINNIQKLSNLIGQENLRGKTLELDFFQTWSLHREWKDIKIFIMKRKKGTLTV